MDFIIYDTPEYHDDCIIYEHCKKDGALLVAACSHIDEYEVFAEASYCDNYNEQDILSEFEKKTGISKDDKFIIRLEPIPKSNIDMFKIRLIKKRKLSMIIKSLLHENLKRYKKAFGVDDDTFYVVFRDVDAEYVSYQGFTIENPVEIKQKIYDTIHDYAFVLPISEILNEELDRSDNIKTILKKWYKSTTFEEFSKDIGKRIIGQPQMKCVAMAVYNYIEAVIYEKKINHNVILAAPSGCGKTETYRAIEEYFSEEVPQLPISRFDTSSLTEVGIKGNNAVKIVDNLLKHSDTNGIGIVWLDEFDKKLVPSFGSIGSDYNLAVQGNMLMYIEGHIVEEERTKNKIDTKNTMFIASGSFNSIREKKEKNKRTLGFGSFDDVDYLKAEISRADIIDMGGSYELIGRFPVLLNYNNLSSKAIKQIIERDRKIIEDLFDINISISHEVIEKLVDEANGNYGCRGLYSLLYEYVLRIKAENPQTQSVNIHL